MKEINLKHRNLKYIIHTLMLAAAAMILSFAVQSVVLASETTAETETAQSEDAATMEETSETEETEQETKKVGRWYTAKSGNVYYYNENDKKLKNGKYKINGKYYYFDSKGIQRTGWQKIGSSYYYFRIGKRKNGYMVTSKTVNGIYLRKNGKARMTSYSKRKLPILYKANVIMRSVTKNSDTKAQKLKKLFEYTKTHYKYSSIGSFPGGKNWDLYYAERSFINGALTADCHNYGVIFAYLANAVGYKASAVSSGGHGWAEIGNYVYDPSWSLTDKTHNYFGMPYGTTGTNVPNYAKGRYYVITI
ncbi:MAG: hypothetical protein LUG99_22345 [Lachnospiraceae bacterium]|nr:hypothetical protein [Lachnospiraceae bacterium]